jgi:hypothetical protein
MPYIEGMSSAPGGIDDTAAQVRAGLAASTAAADSAQQDAARYIVEHGAQVIDGHSPVGQVEQHYIGVDSDADA